MIFIAVSLWGFIGEGQILVLLPGTALLCVSQEMVAKYVEVLHIQPNTYTQTNPSTTPYGAFLMFFIRRGPHFLL